MRTSRESLAWLLTLLTTGSGCNHALGIYSHADAAIKSRDASSNVDVAPKSQPLVGGQCADGFAACGKGEGIRCYDLSRSPDHCGACESACGPGIACQAGSCQQPRCTGPLSFKTVVFGDQGLIGALGDFDGDGILDLIGAPDYVGAMTLLYGVGDGTFGAGQVVEPSTFSTWQDSGLPFYTGWQALAADLDGDGRTDLVSIGGSESIFKVRLASGNRDNPFGDPISYPTTSSPTSLLLGDFDADGRLDLVVGVGGGFEYWRGEGAGRFARQMVLSIRDVPSPNPLLFYGAGMTVATDWNGDGALDLIYGEGGFAGVYAGPVLGGQARIHYRLGHGDGTFDAEVVCALGNGLIGDLDHDHRPDLISSSSTKGATLLLGIEGCSASKIVPITDWTKQGGAALADFNGDGNLDVVLDDNLAIMVHVGDGQGGFPHALTLPAPTEGQWPIGAFLVGDLNRDGKLDAVFARSGGWGVLINTCQ